LCITGAWATFGTLTVHHLEVWVLRRLTRRFRGAGAGADDGNGAKSSTVMTEP
jgi:hypothetical protein